MGGDRIEDFQPGASLETTLAARFRMVMHQAVFERLRGYGRQLGAGDAIERALAADPSHLDALVAQVADAIEGRAGNE